MRKTQTAYYKLVNKFMQSNKVRNRHIVSEIQLNLVNYVLGRLKINRPVAQFGALAV